MSSEILSEITEPKVVEMLKSLTPDELLDHEGKIEKEHRRIRAEACRQETARLIKNMSANSELNVHGPVSMLGVFKDALARAERFVEVINSTKKLP